MLMVGEVGDASDGGGHMQHEDIRNEIPWNEEAVTTGPSTRNSQIQVGMGALCPLLTRPMSLT